MKPLVFSLVVLLAAAATAGAAGRHALILCNQNYKSIGVLKTPLAEAEEAKKTLATLGFEGNITVVTDATTAKMTETVDSFASKLTDADVALFKPNVASVFVDLGQEFCFEKDGGRRFKLISKSTRALEDAGHTQQTNQSTIVLKIRVVTTGQEFELVQRRETEVSIGP